MRAVILSPGPSLATYTPQSADVIIAVNRAALAHACDVWAALDYPMIRDNAVKVRGTPNLLSRQQTITDLKPPRLTRFPNVIAVESLFEFCPPNLMPWTLFTMTCAMIYAAYLGTNAIDIYGADFKGTQDYDGVEAGERRTEERWERDEKPLYARVKAWIEARGISVTRHERT